MELRDKLKDRKYFKTFIEGELDDINYYEQKLEKNEVREDRIDTVRKQIYIAKYYANYSIEIELTNILCAVLVIYF